LPSSALRLARRRSKQLVRDTESLIDRWRAIRARKRSNATFIGVTGSSAKTTTTSLIAHILSGVAEVRAQYGANVYRSHVRSMQKMAPDGSYVVNETGASGPGTLQPVLDVVRPTVGVVTLVAIEHRSTFQNAQAVAKEKAKLVEVLPASGLAVLNADDPLVAAMAERTKAKVVTFGKTGADYLITKARCDVPEALRLTLSHQGQAFDIVTSMTGVHQSVAVAAAFACTHQLGVAPAVILERIASYTPYIGRCTVHRVPGGPTIIHDAGKAPYHSLHLVFAMLAGFKAPRKRIVIGHISDGTKSNMVYGKIYRQARKVADQVIFVGEHAHRSKASEADIAAGHFAAFRNVSEAAAFVKQSAIPGEIIVLKSALNLHLERVMLTFFYPVHCWINVCGQKTDCVKVNGKGCGLYGVPYQQHANARHVRIAKQPEAAAAAAM
jgi:UDP-N-acetylmuramoyl-tripeptide--D-alanyl-D-alanine ligase